MTSLSDLLGAPVNLREVKAVFQSSFEEVFGEFGASPKDSPGIPRVSEANLGLSQNSPTPSHH
jgi:hypothetical protein